MTRWILLALVVLIMAGCAVKHTPMLCQFVAPGLMYCLPYEENA